MNKETCPITAKPFNCQKCKSVTDGKCPYMKLDDWAEETLGVMRKLVERELNEKGTG